jgi:hypothetical protein
MKKPTRKSDKDVGNTLKDFHQVVQRLGEQEDVRTRERCAAMEKDLPTYIYNVKLLDDNDLLDQLVNWSGGRSSLNETAIRVKYYSAVRKEILRRIHSTPPSLYLRPLGTTLKTTKGKRHEH